MKTIWDALHRHSPSSAPGFAHAERDIGAAFIMALDHHGITASNGTTVRLGSAMKFVLASYGTRGDIEPSAAVGRELLRRGHEVRMGVPPDLVGLVESAGPPHPRPALRHPSPRDRPDDQTRRKRCGRRRSPGKFRPLEAFWLIGEGGPSG
jgi:glycosyl transferase family 28